MSVVRRCGKRGEKVQTWSHFVGVGLGDPLETPVPRRDSEALRENNSRSPRICFFLGRRKSQKYRQLGR